MNLKIGTIIKRLRTENNITQDALATAIGVTPQAISRWESEGGYPDIELLPALADFFSVSTDELIGYQLSEREKVLADTKKELERLFESGSVEAATVYARNAFARYPNDYGIRADLAECLYCKWTERHEETLTGEIETLLKPVVNECVDGDIRYHAIRTLVSLYGDSDRPEKALELVRLLAPMKYRREQILSGGIGDGKTKFYIQDEIDKLASALDHAIRNLALNAELPNDSSTWAQKIEMLRISNRLYSIIYGDDLLYHHGSVSYNHWLISTYQMALGKTADALESLEKMCDHAVACDLSYQNDHGKHFTSFLVDTQTYPGESEGFHDFTAHTQCYYMLENLQHPRYDCIRQDPRFLSVIDRLNLHAK